MLERILQRRMGGHICQTCQRLAQLLFHADQFRNFREVHVLEAGDLHFNALSLTELVFHGRQRRDHLHRFNEAAWVAFLSARFWPRR